MNETHQATHRTADEDSLGVLQHLMAAGQMVAAQLPTPSNWTPEKRLAASVLASALVEVRDQAGAPRRQQEVAETIEWIMSDDTEWPYSFLRLCQLFDLQPEWVRKVVRSWLQAARKQSRRPSIYRQAA
ncbi:MAG: hypothetical protein H6Q33_3899 [Deltaproteobacteria bacterium]|nr:hypothetical protein [Deltaproteobacteria bacterium]